MKRNKDIEKAYKRELNLQTQVVKSKKRYTRKAKHVNRRFDQTDE